MNQKGGVGKTTTSMNFSAALARMNKRLLLLDTDPQGHLGNSFGQWQQQPGMDEVILEQQAIQNYIHNIRPNIDMVMAGPRLGEIESRVLEGGINKGLYLARALQGITAQKNYDFIFMDCPPSSGLLGMNALLAARELLIPVTADYLALQGLSRLIQVVNTIEEKMSLSMQKWFVLTRFYERRKLARQIRDKLIQYFPGQVLRTPIRESVALAESPGFGKTIFEYQAKSHGSEDYQHLAQDFMRQHTW